MAIKKFLIYIVFALSGGILCAMNTAVLPDSVDLPDTLATAHPKIGSHHSLSYVKPKWYWRPFGWMVKCQRLTLSEQLEAGVVYFDIRVRFKNNKVISGHGAINYDVDVLAELEMLNAHSSAENPLYVRIMYESKPLTANPTVERMKEFMSELREAYPNLIFTECHIRNPYTLVERISDIPKKDCYQFYKDYGARNIFSKIRGLKIPHPKHYASKKNAEYVEMLEDTDFPSDTVYIFDFVDIHVF